MLPFEDIEQNVFHYTHAELGGYVLEKWNLPKALITAVIQHHTFDFSEQDDNYQRSLTAVTALADLLCVKLGIGARSPIADLDIAGSQAATTLRFGEETLMQLESVVAETYMQDKGFFNL
jgi:HD-like signal output (HDOD) protein